MQWLRDAVRALLYSERGSARSRRDAGSAAAEYGPRIWQQIARELHRTARSANAELGDDAITVHEDAGVFSIVLKRAWLKRDARVAVSADWRSLTYKVDGGRQVGLSLVVDGATAEYEASEGDYFLPSDIATYVIRELLTGEPTGDRSRWR